MTNAAGSARLSGADNARRQVLSRVGAKFLTLVGARGLALVGAILLTLSGKEQVMRKIAVWAALIVGGGTMGLAQDGAQTGAPGGRGVPAGVEAPAAGGRAGGEGRTVILEQAPKDHSISIPKEKLAQHLKDMDAKKLQTLRMIEGGKYNVNIRRITAAKAAAR
jgi:hypothetical protein